MVQDRDARRLMFEWAGPGTCINCGFLAFSRSSELTEALEISLRRRANPHGEDPNFPSPLPGWWYCFVYAANLPDEMGQLERDGVPGNQRQAQIIARGRDCPEFYTGVPGFDPRWHFQDRTVQRLEELRRANDLKIAELDQRSQQSLQAIMEAQLQIAEEHATTASANKAILERSEKQATWFQWAFVVLAFVALALALAPLGYPNGVPWLVDHLPGAAREATPLPQLTPDTATPQPTVGP